MDRRGRSRARRIRGDVVRAAAQRITAGQHANRQRKRAQRHGAGVDHDVGSVCQMILDAEQAKRIAAGEGDRPQAKTSPFAAEGAYLPRIFGFSGEAGNDVAGVMVGQIRFVVHFDPHVADQPAIADRESFRQRAAHLRAAGARLAHQLNAAQRQPRPEVGQDQDQGDGVENDEEFCARGGQAQKEQY
jgi:hypothetical protein